MECPQLKSGKESKVWIKDYSNKIGRLVRGVYPQMMAGSNTINFIHPIQNPTDRVDTYLRIVLSFRPPKKDPYQIRFTVGGNRIDYPGDVTTPTAELLICNITALYISIDIKDYYFGTTINRYEYMLIPVKYIPLDIMIQYKLASLVVNNNVIVEIRKGIYGLLQAGLISQQRLNVYLYKHWYTPAAPTPGLYTHHKKDNFYFCSRQL